MQHAQECHRKKNQSHAVVVFIVESSGGANWYRERYQGEEALRPPAKVAGNLAVSLSTSHNVAARRSGKACRETLIAGNSPLALSSTEVDKIGDSASCLASEVVYAKEILRKFSFHSACCGGW